MRVSHLKSILAVLATVACPGPGVTTATGISTGGGASSPGVLVFIVQPSRAEAGDAITPAIQVEVRDTVGNADSSFAGSIAIAIGANPVGGSLSGTTSVTPVFAVARFGNLSIDRAGIGYTLTATAPGASSVTSLPFDIVAP